MAEITRKSRMAIVEGTEGSVTYPSAGTDFLALQDGFSVELSQETLDNAELKGSIGASKSIVGIEAPTASVSHYLRHSGTEGQAPQNGYANLLEAAFGAEYVAGTEYNTVASSTVTVVKVDTGEGANFRIGQALLIKHSAFPWEIGVIKSISGDDLTMLFQLANAPATGTNLGKAVHYNAEDAAIPVLDLHDYRGNGGAYQIVQNARVVSLDIEATAGELVNCSFSLEGIAGYYDPIKILSADRYLDFTDDDGTFAAIVEAKTYKNPHQMAEALQAAMALANPLQTPTVTYSDSTGKFTIKTTGTVLSLLWNTGTNAANTIGDKIGFSTAANDTGTVATTGYTSDNAQDWSSPYTPSLDSPGTPLVAKNNKVMIGAQDDYTCFGAQSFSLSMATPKTNVPSICAESGISGTVINSREVNVTVTATMERHKADMFHAMIKNDGVAFQYNFGPKSGSNYVAGQSGSLHLKDASVLSHVLGDADGLVTLEIELKAFVDSSANAECGLNLL